MLCYVMLINDFMKPSVYILLNHFLNFLARCRSKRVPSSYLYL